MDVDTVFVGSLGELLDCRSVRGFRNLGIPASVAHIRHHLGEGDEVSARAGGLVHERERPVEVILFVVLRIHLARRDDELRHRMRVFVLVRYGIQVLLGSAVSGASRASGVNGVQPFQDSLCSTKATV